MNIQINGWYVISFYLQDDMSWEVVAFSLSNPYELDYLKAYLAENGNKMPLRVCTFVLWNWHSSMRNSHSCYGKLHSSYFPQIDGDGACLFRSVHAQMKFEDDENQCGAHFNPTDDSRTFTAYRLRLFVVRMLIDLCQRVSKYTFVLEI